MPRTLIPLTLYLVSLFGAYSGVSFCDSTKLSVCHNRRISRHKTFKNIAQRGKTSVGWFFGFKLHLLFNDQGEVVWLLPFVGAGVSLAFGMPRWTVLLKA